MPIYQLQTTIKMVSALAEDSSQNNFCIIADSDSDAITAMTSFQGFYNDLVTLYSDLVAQNGHTMKLYRQADPPPRAPIQTSTFNLGAAPSGSPQPTEVALCVSFQGAPTSGVPQARRRGRVYIGPIDVTSLHSDGRPTTASVTQAKTAGANLLTASNSASTWSWGVYSPTSGSAVVVTNGWVDNEWDTQRRRGRKATSRNLFV